MYKKIAVATDGSPMGGKAVDAAARLAVLADAELTVLHVLMHGEPPEALVRMAEVEHMVKDDEKVETALSYMLGSPAAADAERHCVDQDAIAAMGDIIAARAVQAAKALKASKVTSEVLHGDTTAEICGAARRIGADLIVVGSRGLGPLKRLLMGSVSQKVGQHADCACLIVK